MKLQFIGRLAATSMGLFAVCTAATVGLAMGVPSASAANSGPALKSGQEYLLATNYPNNLHLIDVATDKLYKTCEMPDAFGPGAAQVAPDKKTAYVLNNHYGDIYGIDMDTCKTVFHARLAYKPGEQARAMLSLAVSPDGKEVYTVANPTLILNDHYAVQEPRLQVYSTDAGLDAKPVRTFPVPRQVSIMQVGDDGTLYMAGRDIYKLDVNTGKYSVALPTGSWTRPHYSPPDLLYIWSHQSPRRDFSLLYTAAKFKDDTQDPATADYVYGYVSVDLATGKTETTDFAPLTEVYFTGMRSPKDPNQMFSVLNRLAKYDIKEQKLIKAAKLAHSYYCISFNKAGSKLYLTGTFSDIAVYDPDKLELTNNIKLPGGDMVTGTAQVFTR
ncbi:quinohemoprotein amine dehydrogenase subunit beta [Pseudomonas arcuscaelestis]|jgi:quinohemoprotein amine dehydrogenase beta subunit